MTLLAPTLQGFFTDRLVGQRNASPHTVAAYRDTFRLLLTFASRHLSTPASRLRIDTPQERAQAAAELRVRREDAVHDRGPQLVGDQLRGRLPRHWFQLAQIIHGCSPPSSAPSPAPDVT